MARLGHKALQQIDHEPRRPPTHEGSLSNSIDRGGAAPTGSEPREVPSANQPANQAVSTQQADVDGTSDMPLVAPVPEMAMGSPLTSMNDLDSTMHGFADIDTLFGEFLDLSLPTNFWDPIFAEEDPGSG